MSTNYAIKVENIKKSYKVYQDRTTTLKEKIIHLKQNKYEERQVINDISFEILKGEAVGLIGKNGCGKSTTLKLLTQIIFPDSGSISVKGRVSSLLELGAGFHPDMSGRENIYTNASIFGLNKKEIEERLESIISFSELQEFIDNPVRTYSSGMYMRLAFSVAINVDADVLLIDEILAVGDVSFQKKCIDKIKEIKRMGVTIVIVSHSLGQIEEICEKTIWIDKGKVKLIGAPNVIHPIYQEEMEILRLEKIRKLNRANNNDLINNTNNFHKLTIRSGNGSMRFKDVWLEDAKSTRQSIFNSGDNIIINASYESFIEPCECIVSIAITRQDGVLCYAENSLLNNQLPMKMEKNGILKIFLKECKLLTNSYMLNIASTSIDGDVYDDLQRVLFFKMVSSEERMGICEIECNWSNKLI